MDIRLQKRVSDFTRGLLDVTLGYTTLPSQVLQDFLQLVREVLKHFPSPGVAHISWLTRINQARNRKTPTGVFDWSTLVSCTKINFLSEVTRLRLTKKRTVTKFLSQGLFPSSDDEPDHGSKTLRIAERKVLQSMRYIIAGTAGHIDHGKSALVKALTGTDPDRLK